MKKLLLAVFLLSSVAQTAQSQEKEESTALGQTLEIHGGISLNGLLGITYSHPISDKFLMGINAGFNGFSYKHKFGYEKPLWLFASGNANVKYIFNRENRKLKNKPLDNNSGNFIKAGIFGQTLINDSKTRDFNSVIYATWGQKFNTNKSFSFEYEIGPAYSPINNNFEPFFGVSFLYSIPIF